MLERKVNLRDQTISYIPAKGFALPTSGLRLEVPPLNSPLRDKSIAPQANG
jgi:hypothetical protein